MRIIAGRFRGRRLAALGKGDAGAHLRPTTDRVRESLFNMLAGGRFGDPFEDALVLDLFAGTGALGLEALSRGAARAVFVDDGRVAGRLIRENIKMLEIGADTRLISHDATRLPKAETSADLIFLDPPYGKGLGGRALAAAAENGWIGDNSLIVWEESSFQAPPTGFKTLETRQYGDTFVTVMSPDDHRGIQ